MDIEKISDDICVIKRFSKSFQSSYVLIVRMNYDPNAEPKDVDLEIPGWLNKTKKVYYFEKDFEIINDEIPRIKARIIENDNFQQFGFVSHR